MTRMEWRAKCRWWFEISLCFLILVWHLLRKHPMAQRWNQLIDFMSFHHAVVAARQGPCQKHSWGSYPVEKGGVPWPLEQLILIPKASTWRCRSIWLKPFWVQKFLFLHQKSVVVAAPITPSHPILEQGDGPRNWRTRSVNHVARSGTPRGLSFQIVEFCPKHFAIFLPLKVANIPEFLMLQKKRDSRLAG